MNKKRAENLGRKSKFVSFRIRPDVETVLKQCAETSGISTNAYAAEALLEKLEGVGNHTKGWKEVYDEVRQMRADLALLGEAILTLTGKGENAREKAATWVRSNLNR